MIYGFAAILALQLIGEVAVHAIGLSIPGPVLGMALLVVALAIWNRISPMTDDQVARSEIGRASLGLLENLALLFVPAGVGVVQYLGLVADYGVALAAALVISTVVALIVTASVFLLVKKVLKKNRHGEVA